MLQVILLTEKEITAVLGIDRKIAGKVGLERVAHDKELEQLSQHTSIDDVAQTIKDKLPPNSSRTRRTRARETPGAPFMRSDSRSRVTARGVLL